MSGDEQNAEDRVAEKVRIAGAYYRKDVALARIRRLLREVKRDCAERAAGEVDDQPGTNWREQREAMKNRIRAAVMRKTR